MRAPTSLRGDYLLCPGILQWSACLHVLMGKEWTWGLLGIFVEYAKISVTNFKYFSDLTRKINSCSVHTMQMSMNSGLCGTGNPGALPSRDVGTQASSIFWFCHFLLPWNVSFISDRTGKREHRDYTGSVYGQDRKWCVSLPPTFLWPELPGLWCNFI